MMEIWTPSDVVTVIAALSAFAVSVINALKTTEAKTQGEGNQQRINAIAQHLQNHDQQLTSLALNMPPPGATAAVAPTSPVSMVPAPDGDLIAPQGGDAEDPQ